MAGTWTHRGTSADAGNMPNSSASINIAIGDLVVVIATIEGNTADHTVSGTNGYNLTYGLIRKQLFGAGADQLSAWISTAKASSNTAGVVTVSTGGSGSNISVYTISGMTLLGAAGGGPAVLQQNGETTQAAGEVPSVAFSNTTLDTSAILGAVGVVDGTPALTAPTSFAEGPDTGYTTGKAQGIEVVTRDSGHASATVAWITAVTGGDYATIILELDARAIVPLAAASAVFTDSLALTAPALTTLAASSMAFTPTLDLTAPTVSVVVPRPPPTPRNNAVQRASVW